MGKSSQGGVLMEELKTLAIVSDGEVVAIMKFDENTSNILLSNPTFIDITASSINTGWEFDGNSFYTVVNGEQVSIPVNGNSV